MVVCIECHAVQLTFNMFGPNESDVGPFLFPSLFLRLRPLQSRAQANVKFISSSESLAEASSSWDIASSMRASTSIGEMLSLIAVFVFCDSFGIVRSERV